MWCALSPAARVTLSLRNISSRNATANSLLCLLSYQSAACLKSRRAACEMMSLRFTDTRLRAQPAPTHAHRQARKKHRALPSADDRFQQPRPSTNPHLDLTLQKFLTAMHQRHLAQPLPPMYFAQCAPVPQQKPEGPPVALWFCLPGPFIRSPLTKSTVSN